MTNKLLSRNEVNVNETWDLSHIYESEELLQQDVEKMKQLTDDVISHYKGKLTSADTIVSCLDQFQEIIKIATLAATYTDLDVSVDYTNSTKLKRNAQMTNTYSDIISKLSFIETEIIEQSKEVLNSAIELATTSKCYLKEILKKKEHYLNKETERALAALSPILDSPYSLYEQTKLADMVFDDFTVNKKTYPLGYSLFEDKYEYEPDTDVRRAAFDSFSNKLKQYINTTATEYNTQVKKEKILSDLRGYSSVFEYLLSSQNVTQDLYHRQIDLITEKLAPHMQKYAKLIQKIYKLDTMTFADLHLPIDPDFDPHVTIEESKKYILDGLSILGDDYGKMIQAAYNERWVDFASNQGKSTGGFCASPYGKNSYILLSWHNKMSDVFTLAHELGHAGHFKSCNSKQSILDTNVSNYFVEAPSTMNELLMAHHLLKTSTDKRFRRWVLSCMVSNTYYHNFVTHLMEAAYQREVYRIIDKGDSVQADTLCTIMKDTLKNFWSDAVEINDGAELTWMRQPHYYMGLYSYTYSAGLTIATQVCKRIEKEGQEAVEDWKKVLECGSTLDPIALAKLAKVDITTDAPLLDTISYIGELIDEICSLTEEIEKENA